MRQKIVVKYLILTFLLLTSIISVYSPNFNKSKNNKFERNNLKLGYSYTLAPFIIDDAGGGDYTWSQAVAQSWCSGVGTWDDPYIINDISISGYMRDEHCIEIRNSEAFFVINNSRFWRTWGGYHGAVFSNVKNGLIINNEILTTYDLDSCGIYMTDISNISLQVNQIYDIDNDGIRVINGDKLTLINNTVYNTDTAGFDLANINNCTIKDNEIYSNYHSGIILTNCNESKITKNNIYDQFRGNGIWLELCNNNNISQNNIKNNGATGIVVAEGSKNNLIKDNIIRDNDDYGISVGGFPGPRNNLIYYNFIFGNSLKQASSSTNEINYWDNGSMGNYWGDYAGIDRDGNGIGDTPYVINSNYGTQDNFPIWISNIVISINNPTHHQIIEETGPEFNIEISNGIPDRMWYTLGGNTTKYFFTSNGTINQNAWEWCANGDVVIIFSANNSIGNIFYSEVTVKKDIDAPIISIISPQPFEIYGNLTLMYVISVEEPNLDNIWYSIKGSNYTITNMIGKIDQEAWSSCDNGTVSIKFYANDTQGRLGSQEIIILKDINFIKMWNLSGVPIYIDNTNPNYSWAKIESENPWCRGSGTLLDPYIIENVIIDGYTNDSCITILNSDVHFIIQNCELFNGIKRGVWIDNTKNGILAHNIIHDNQYQGIYLNEYCEWNQILNNEIYNHSGSGINFYMYCDNNIILENVIYTNDNDGIVFFQYCTDNKILKNNITKCGRNGIGLGILCSRSEIVGNFLSTNADKGLVINAGFDCIIKGNTISYHNLEGMYLHIYNSICSDNVVNNNQNGIIAYTEERPEGYINIFTNNTIANHTNCGLSAGSPQGEQDLHLIYKNYFINNTLHAHSGIHQQWDNGSIGNYWDDYTGIDANDDGIGDSSYMVDGIPSSDYDLYPIWDDGDDVASPKITIITPVTNQYFSSNAPSFELSIGGLYVNTTWYNIIGGSTNKSFTGFSGQIDQNLWDEFGNGTIKIRFYVNDSLGNVGIDEVTVFKDIILPEIIVYNPQNNDLFGISPPSYNLFINESNLDTTWYTFTNGQTNTTFIGNGTFDHSLWSSLSNGTVFIKFYARDKAGNIGFSEIKIYKDIIAPEIEIINPLDLKLCGSEAPEFEVFYSDPLINSTWYSLGGYNFSFTENATFNQVAWDLVLNGSVIITFYINDSVGNTGYDQVEIRKDILAPIIDIISPNLNEKFSFNAPDYELSITEGNIDTIWYTLDGGVSNITLNYLSGTLNQSIWNNSADGYFNIIFFANDTLGQIGYKNITIEKDTEAPYIYFEVSDVFIEPPVLEYYHLNLEIKCTVFNSSDILWVYLCENSTGTFINRSMILFGADYWAYNLDISGLNWGDRFSIMFIANDTAGNIGINDNLTSLFTIRIFDLQKPLTTISFIPHNVLYNVNRTTSFSLIANDNGGSGISFSLYQINNSDWVIFNGSFNLSDNSFGKWQISFYSIDNSGNIEGINIIIVNLIDTTPPPPPQNIPGYKPFIILGILFVTTMILTKKSKMLHKNFE